MPGLITNAAFTKTFPAPAGTTYAYTATVLHQGTMIAFAMDAAGVIYYSVLNFNDPTLPPAQLDVKYWSTRLPDGTSPIPLAFPTEIRKAGQGSFGQTTVTSLTIVSTGQFTAVAPFCAVSDGSSIFVFRKSNQPNTSTAVANWTFGDGALLVDRYSLSGGSLLQKSEARYQRSRSKDFPANNKDCLSPKDMNGKPFYEPTIELGFVQNFDSFTVSLIPTAVASTSYWQIFAHSTAGPIDAYSVLQAQDGLFDFAGALSFACPNRDHPDFAPHPGTCGRPCNSTLTQVGSSTTYTCTNGHTWTKPSDWGTKPLPLSHACGLALAQVSTATSADACVALGGGVSATLPGIQLPSNFTIEFWCRRSQASLSDSCLSQGGGGLVLGFAATTGFQCTGGGAAALASTKTPDTYWHHYAVVYAGATRTLYIDGLAVASDSNGSFSASIGSQSVTLGTSTTNSTIYVDELRVWNIGLSSAEIQTGMQVRRAGNEKGLLHYFRLNEGKETTLVDLAPDGIWENGTLSAASGWAGPQAASRPPTAQDSPVTPSSGVRHNSFQAHGFRHSRFTVIGGHKNLAARLYYQQEIPPGGSKPQKSAAHLMLALDGGSAGINLGVLDFAIGADGRLVAAPGVVPMDSLPLTGQSVALPRIFSDGHYLSLSGGRLDVAPGALSPQLLDSSTGDLRLYWATTSTNSPTLCSLTYDTSVTRPQYQLIGQNGTIALIGTVAGPDLNDVVVSISAVSGATCTVLISHGTLGTETWPLVPTDSPSFAAVLNGTPLPPPAGSIVPQTYDYTKASSTWPGAELSGGSLWVSVQPSTSTVTVLNNSSSTCTTAGTPACFRAVPTANAISLDVPLQLATPPAQGAAVPATPPWDLTLETWVKPVHANGQILIGQNVPTAGSTPATGYALGLRSTANGLAAAASMIKANSSGAQWTIQAQTTPDTTQPSTLIPPGEWSHVAAAFRQKSAVRFDGTSAFADCGDDDGTNITGDLTLEAWLSVPANQTWPLGILSRGLLGNGAVDPVTRAATVSRVPYALYVNDTGKLTFVYSRTSGNLCYAEGPSLPTGPTAIAVTRRCNLSRTDTNGNVFIWDEISFYIRGQTPAAPKVVFTINPTSAPTVSDTSPIVGNSASLILGRCTPALTHAAASGGVGMTATPASPAAASSFNGGTLSELRLWSAVQNPPWANLDSADATTSGLASRWRFEERSGSQAIDTGPTSRSSAMLMNGYTWVPSPDPSLSGWTLYLNGVAQRTAPISWVAYIPPANLSLGDFSPVTAPAGQVAELRIWSTERTPQAIANNIYRPLARDPLGQVLEDGGDLLAYYALDSASGWSSVPKVVDRSLSGSGTLAPAPLNAMYWNGQTSATILAPNIPLTSSFTVEFWCRRTDSLREGFILTQNTANPGTNQCLFIGFMGVRGENCDNQVQFAFYNNDLNVTSNANRDGIWHHWAFVYDRPSSRRTIYLDGQQIATLVAADYTGGGGAITLVPVMHRTVLNGWLQELRIWNGALTPATIQANMYRALRGSETGATIAGTQAPLLALWPMTNVSGTTLPDKCGSHNATLVPAGALYWDGQTSATVAGTIALQASFTLEFWCKRIAKDREDMILGQFTNLALDQALHIGFRANNMATFAFYWDDINYTGPACTDLKWHHWAFVYDTSSNPRRRVYIDGILCTTGVAENAGGNGVYAGSGPVKLGTVNYSNNKVNAFVQEMRIWNSALTANTIIANMNTVKTGSAAGLVALWPMVYPTTTSILDLTPNNHTATASSSFAAPARDPSRAAIVPATPVSSTAPIGPDIPEITNAVGGVATSVAANASMPLGVEEYGVIEVNADGDAVAVLKRGFSLIQGGKWLLAGGYKVANLGLEWIGQVQFAPQLMGYIEGAPPVPGENMTNPLGAYCGASTVAFTCADEVNYAYTAQRDKGFDYSVDMKARFGISAGSSFIATVLGIGTSTEVVKVDWEAGIASKIEGSTSVVNGATAAFTLSQTQLNQTDLQGYFYDALDGLGARFVPLNVGSAFVKSSTADLYALRLLSNSALVGYQMVPDLKIPPDWNIITFPINPYYTRQGCLDGRFGYWDKNSTFTVKADPFFPAAASGADASYHRVAEAYALKSQIDREHQQLYNQYADNDAVAQGSASWVDANRAKASMSKYVPGAGNRPALSLGSSTPVTKGQGSAGDAASDPTQLVKRNLCNTYVWTAYGGLYAETEQSLDGFTETHGGGYQFKGLAGLSMEGKYSYGSALLTYELDALFGGHVNVTMTKAATATTGFGMTVTLGLPRDLSYYPNTPTGIDAGELPIMTTQDDNVANVNSTSLLYSVNVNGSTGPLTMITPAPGRVDAYRFMTFYLAPTANNYREFFNRVVNPSWLTSGDPNAVALRSAMQNTEAPPCWRVLHRVTFVSRVTSASAATTMESSTIKLNPGSHYLLIKQLEPYVRGSTANWPSLLAAVTTALQTCYGNATDFPAIAQGATVTQIAQLMASYYGVTVP